MKYDLKGYLRSHMVILKLQNQLFLQYIICLTPDLKKKTLKNVNIMKTQILQKIKYDHII